MNINGNGFIAKNLRKIIIPKNFFIYAAGVSNSSSKNKKFFKRELNQFKNYLKKIKTNDVIIYISSTTLENKSLKNIQYVKNKLKIEKIIQRQIKNYIIIRLPQIVGKNNNKYTLTNFIFNCFKKNKELALWQNSIRNIIDIEDLIKIIEKYLNNKPKINSIINICNPRSIEVSKLIYIFSKILKKNIKTKIIKKNNKNINYKNFKKNTLLPSKYYKIINYNGYYKAVIKKYYR